LFVSVSGQKTLPVEEKPNLVELGEKGRNGKTLEKFEDKGGDGDSHGLGEHNVMAMEVALQTQRNPLLEQTV
jgi:hypothetical protein